MAQIGPCCGGRLWEHARADAWNGDRGKRENQDSWLWVCGAVESVLDLWSHEWCETGLAKEV